MAIGLRTVPHLIFKASVIVVGQVFNLPVKHGLRFRVKHEMLKTAIVMGLFVRNPSDSGTDETLMKHGSIKTRRSRFE